MLVARAEPQDFAHPNKTPPPKTLTSPFEYSVAVSAEVEVDEALVSVRIRPETEEGVGGRGAKGVEGDFGAPIVDEVEEVTEEIEEIEVECS